MRTCPTSTSSSSASRTGSAPSASRASARSGSSACLQPLPTRCTTPPADASARYRSPSTSSCSRGKAPATRTRTLICSWQPTPPEESTRGGPGEPGAGIRHQRGILRLDLERRLGTWTNSVRAVYGVQGTPWFSVYTVYGDFYLRARSDCQGGASTTGAPRSPSELVDDSETARIMASLDAFDDALRRWKRMRTTLALDDELLAEARRLTGTTEKSGLA